MTESTQTNLQSQIEVSPVITIASYHKQAHATMNNSGILASAYAFILHGTRAAARASLTADAAIYKSCDKAIEALDALTIS